MLQRQVLVIQTVQKTVEFPQNQCLVPVVDVPVALRHQVPTIRTLQKTVEVSQNQYLDPVVDVPVVWHAANASVAWKCCSSQVSSTSVTSNSAEICTPMSCFHAARPFSKGLVSTEILRASRREHHHCCRQTLPLRFLPAAEKAKSIADMVLRAPRGKHPHCWRQTLPLRGSIVPSRRREGYCS